MSDNVKYISNNGQVVCGKHIQHGGLYLECEVKAPNNTISSRYTVDGAEYIQTPLANWVVVPPDADFASMYADLECERCQHEKKILPV